MAGFDIDPESMRLAADQLDGAKDDVQSLLDEFTGAPGQFADAFGGDEIGTLVGIADQACVDAPTECFSTNIEDLTDYAECLQEMTEGHQATDDDTAQGFEQLLGQPGG